MKVYLDDERATPEGWFRVYEPHQAIALLESGLVTHISLDHDLGDDDGIGTGNDVLVWIEEQVYTNNFDPPRILVHSANPSARQKMQAGIEQIRKMYETKCNYSGCD
jgi:hypothetical protein